MFTNEVIKRKILSMRFVHNFNRILLYVKIYEDGAYRALCNTQFKNQEGAGAA